MNNAKKEENTRTGKTRDVFKKINAKGTPHARIGTIDSNSKDLIEAEKIKKRWQEYTE